MIQNNQQHPWGFHWIPHSSSDSESSNSPLTFTFSCVVRLKTFPDSSFSLCKILISGLLMIALHHFASEEESTYISSYIDNISDVSPGFMQSGQSTPWVLVSHCQWIFSQWWRCGCFIAVYRWCAGSTDPFVFFEHVLHGSISSNTWRVYEFQDRYCNTQDLKVVDVEWIQKESNVKPSSSNPLAERETGAPPLWHRASSQPSAS